MSALSVTNSIAHSIPPLQLTAPKSKNTVKPEGSTVSILQFIDLQLQIFQEPACVGTVHLGVVEL